MKAHEHQRVRLQEEIVALDVMRQVGTLGVARNGEDLRSKLKRVAQDVAAANADPLQLRFLTRGYVRYVADGPGAVEGRHVEAGMVRPEGLEPPAYRFEACRSIQLSYGRA